MFAGAGQRLDEFAAMPIEQIGDAIHAPTVGLVVPTGYSFNLDGAAIYLSLAAVYLAQATGAT